MPKMPISNTSKPDYYAMSSGKRLKHAILHAHVIVIDMAEIIMRQLSLLPSRIYMFTRTENRHQEESSYRKLNTTVAAASPTGSMPDQRIRSQAPHISPSRH